MGINFTAPKPTFQNSFLHKFLSYGTIKVFVLSLKHVEQGKITYRWPKELIKFESYLRVACHMIIFFTRPIWSQKNSELCEYCYFRYNCCSIVAFKKKRACRSSCVNLVSVIPKDFKPWRTHLQKTAEQQTRFNAAVIKLSTCASV